VYRRISDARIGRPSLGDVGAAQLQPRPVQLDFDRPLGNPQPGGDRGLGQILLVAQRKQRSLALGEVLQRRPQVGPLDRGDDQLLATRLDLFDLVCRIGARPRVVTEGLVADDRRQPLLAAAGIAQGRASTPGAEQGLLRDVLRLARVARVAVGQPQTNSLCLTPLPAIVTFVRMVPLRVDVANL